MKLKLSRIVKVNLTLAGILLAVLLANAIVTSIYQFQNIASVKSGLEDPLEAWSEVSYIVWQYNSTFYACRNMSTLLVEYFGSNDDTAIQYSINETTAMSNGGTVYVKSPSYTGTYNAAVTLKNKVTLILEQGAAGITVTIDSGATATLIDYQNHDFKYWSAGVLFDFAEGFSQPSTASYVIRTDGTNYFAHNGTTGQVDYSGTNATTIIQNVNDVLTSGGLIWVKGFEIPSAVSFSSNVLAIQEYNGKLIFKSGTMTFSGATLSEFEELSIFHKQDEKSLQTPIIWTPSNYNYTIREAESDASGFWVGANGVLYRDGVFWLSYRYRNTTDRGHVLYIANSTNGINFTNVWSATPSDFSHLGTPQSLEVSKMFYDPLQSLYHIFIDLDLGNSTSREWRIITMDPVSDPADFDASTASIAINVSASGGWDDWMVKEPTGYYDNGMFVLYYIGRDGFGTTAYTDGIGIAYSTDGENFTKYANNPIMTESASNWDSAIIAPYGLIPTSQGTVIYYGGNDDGSGDMDTGIAIWEPDLNTTAQKISVNAPILSSVKYLDIIVHEGSAYCYYEYKMADSSHDLVLAIVDLTEL